MISMNRAEQSRMYLATLASFGLEGDETTYDAAKKIAYAEAISGIGLEEDGLSTGELLCAAGAALDVIFDKTGGEVAEFEIKSLTDALDGSRHAAIFVARLCGAKSTTKGKKTIWRNGDSVPVVKFNRSLLCGFSNEI